MFVKKNDPSLGGGYVALQVRPFFLAKQLMWQFREYFWIYRELPSPTPPMCGYTDRVSDLATG